MSSGDRIPYEVLAVQVGMAKHALCGNANADHESFRAACERAKSQRLTMPPSVRALVEAARAMLHGMASDIDGSEIAPALGDVERLCNTLAAVEAEQETQP